MTATAVNPADLRPAVRAIAQLLLLLGCVPSGVYLFLRGLHAFRLRRMIMNAPRSTTRSAALGFVEVCGKAVGPYTLRAPYVDVECLYFQMGSEEMCAPLFLDDGDGRLMLYPAGAKFRLEGYNAGDPREGACGIVIKPGDTIFAFGTLQENRWAHRSESGGSELSRIGPGFLSQDEADLTWEKGLSPELIAVAARSARPSTDGFDLNPRSILMKGKGPLVISHQSQRGALSKLSWHSIIFIWGGPLITLLGLWRILLDGPSLLGTLLN